MKFDFKAYQAYSCSLYLLKELQNKKEKEVFKTTDHHKSRLEKRIR